MSAISQKSISGITSITTPAGVDNQFTIHTNNTSEALKLDHAGNIHIHNHVNTTGITSASNFKTGSSNLHSTGLTVGDSFVHSTGINIGSNIKFGSTGVITATSFVGDGSDLTNLPAGLGTALSATATSPLNKMYYTNAVLGIAATTTVDVPASASAAYTQYADINIATDADLIIADGDDLIPDVLGLADFGTFGGGTAGRLRVSSISNHTANGAPTVQHGLVVTGVTTSTTFSGSGASLTNLNASNIASGTVPTARLGSGTANSSTFLAGDSTFKTVTGTTINNNADNRVITGSGTANTLEGEATLTFTNSGSAAQLNLKRSTSSNQEAIFYYGSSNLEIETREATGLKLKTNTSDRLTITSDGKSYFVGANSGGFHATTLPNGNTVNINTKTSNDGLSVIRYSSNYGPYAINIGKSKSDTIGTNTLVANGDDLGHITWYGADGSDFNQAAAITVQVDGTPSNGTDMPGRILFKTTPDGSGTPAERLRINSDGSYYFLGDSSNNTRLRLLSDGAITGGSGANDVSLEFASGQSNNMASEGAQLRYDNSNGKLHISTTYNSSDADIRFYTRTGALDSESNLRMNIMGDGYVKTPSQPSFRATKSGSTFNTGGGTVVFDQNQHNTGSNYNTSNGRFTAPVDGTYIFHYYSIYQGNSGNELWDFLKNGSTFAGSRMHFSSGSVGNNWDNITNTQILTLSANDYVEIYATDHTLHGGDWCHFCGHLLG